MAESYPFKKGMQATCYENKYSTFQFLAMSYTLTLTYSHAHIKLVSASLINMYVKHNLIFYSFPLETIHLLIFIYFNLF